MSLPRTALLALALAGLPRAAAALGPGALALAVPAVEADADAAPEAPAPADAPAALRLLRGLEGAYEASPAGVLEIVPYGADTAFFRVRPAPGAAGRQGIARVEGEKLCYVRRERGAACRVEIARAGDDVAVRVVTGGAGCRRAWGAATGAWPLAGRRRIRELERLKHSREYEQAAAEYEGTPSEFVRGLAGLYRTRSRGGPARDARRGFQDVLEIVPNSRDTAFITVHLRLAGGHRCDLEQELAQVEGEKLAYVGFEDDWLCRIEIARAGDKVVLRDATPRQDCKVHCGAQVLMAGEWPYAGRRPAR